MDRANAMKTWTRRAGGAITIVLSILAAFAIQAWWDDRVERGSESAALVGLAEDFQAFGTHLRQTREEHLLRIQAAERILALTGPVPHQEGVDQLVSDLALTKNLNPISLNEGTLRCLPLSFLFVSDYYGLWALLLSLSSLKQAVQCRALSS